MIPAGSTIVKASLYWMTIGGADDAITLGGTPVTGTLIGQAGDTCWGRPEGNFMYRADVTAMVTGNGAYVLGDFPSATSGLDGQGATLVVVYDDPADTRDNFVTVADGAVGFLGDGGGGAANVLGGFTAAAGFDAARALMVVGDGQEFPEELFLEGVRVGGAGPFQGADGNYWDTRFDDVSALLAPGATSFGARITSSNDCLAWTVHGLVIEDVVGD